MVGVLQAPNHLHDSHFGTKTRQSLLDFDELPDEGRAGYQTLSGFVMNQLGSIPRVGQTFTWDTYRFEVVDMDGRRVDKVLVMRLPEEAA